MLPPFRISLFEPTITGTLLYVLTRGPPGLREPIVSRIESLQQSFKYAPSVSSVVTALKWLVALGLLSKVNSVLNSWATNMWKVGNTGKPYNWPTETAVVTGGSSGIGLEVVKILAGRGIKVAILDIQPPLKDMSKSPNVRFYKTNITDLEEVKTVAATVKKELGTVSILVNNAGIGTANTLLEATPQSLERIFNVNLISHWYTIQAFLPDMISQQKGHIVTVASMASFVCAAGMVDYACTKAGALALHEGLGQELKHRFNAPFVKTTVVHPSWVKTPLLGAVDGEIKVSRDREKFVKELMTPEYVAGAICGNILGQKGGQIVLPPKYSRAAGLRGWPHYLQELVRDTTAKITLEGKI